MYIYIYTHISINIYIHIHKEHAQSHFSLRAWLPVPALFVTRSRSFFALTNQPPLSPLCLFSSLSHTRAASTCTF